MVPDCCVSRIRAGPAHRRVPRGDRGFPKHYEGGGSDEHPLRAFPRLTQGIKGSFNLWLRALLMDSVFRTKMPIDMRSLSSHVTQEILKSILGKGGRTGLGWGRGRGLEAS